MRLLFCCLQVETAEFVGLRLRSLAASPAAGALGQLAAGLTPRRQKALQQCMAGKPPGGKQ